MLVVNERIRIPLREMSFTYARGSGPGGQNVNKVNSKVILSWNVTESPSLPGPVRARFLKAFANRINQAGEVVIASDRHRDQGKNQEDCLEKLRAMLEQVAHPPKPRIATKPTRSSRENRLSGKRIRSEVKRQRQRGSWD